MDQLGVSTFADRVGFPRLRDFAGLDCFIGTDLSDKDDITAVALAAKDATGRLLLRTWFFVPEAALARASQSEKETIALYRKWREAGALIVTPGDFIDQRRVERLIRRLKRVLRVLKVIGDQYAAWSVMASVLNEEFGNGDDAFAVILPKNAKNNTDPAKDLEARVKAGPHQLRHDGNPVMVWMAGNAVVDRRVDGSILPKKEKPMSPNKIDGIDATINAMAPMQVPDQQQPDRLPVLESAAHGKSVRVVRLAEPARARAPHVIHTIKRISR